MKRILAFLLSAIMVLGIISGCGNKDDNKSADADTDIPQKTDKDEPVVFDDPIQEALVVVAQAYLAKKNMTLYDSGRMISGSNSFSVYRREIHANSPEDISRQYNIYTTCSGFVNDVYYETLGIKLGADITSALAAAVHMHVFSYFPTLEETQEEKERIMAEFFATLKPGDIINYRYRKENAGHAMLYVGNDNIIHSTRGEGGDFNYGNNTDKLEPGGTVKTLKTDFLFSSGGYDMLTSEQFQIIRPTIHFTDAQLTQETINRLANMRNIVADKTSTHPIGFTADLGEEITYTFSIKNTGDTDATLEILDTVPEYTSYVSSDTDCTVSGNDLKWNVTVPAFKTVTVSYTVKVNGDAALYGKTIQSESTIGGVGVNCKPCYIGKNLTMSEREGILSQAKNAKTFNKQGIELVKAIYSAAGIDVDIPEADAVIEGVFRKNPSNAAYYSLNTESEYFSIVTPTMYGGYNTPFSSAFDAVRTRGIQTMQIMEGDILICEERGKTDLYLYAGENKVLTLDSKAELMNLPDSRDALLSAMGYDRFVLIRPAMAR